VTLRYQNIIDITFGQVALPLPVSACIRRSAEASPAGNDCDGFATDVEILKQATVAEVHLRGTAAAEELSIGQQGNLQLLVSACRSDSPGRTITLPGAVLTAIELLYQQSAMASAKLTFNVEAANGTQEPFVAGDTQ